jgi:hypothetical protein
MDLLVCIEPPSKFEFVFDCRQDRKIQQERCAERIPHREKANPCRTGKPWYQLRMQEWVITQKQEGDRPDI